tara:strand:- start:320 stop:763 length:444 start_codon:yes stop_codon:yes gene_type:complete
MKIIDFKSHHLDEIIHGELNNGSPPVLGHMKNRGSELHQPGWSYTLIHQGHIQCTAGIMPMWDGVGEAWMIASSRIHNNERQFIRYAKSGVMQRLINDHELWRVQANCKVGWSEALRFARMMGFAEEGVMRAYGPEQDDYHRVAWVR